MLLLVMTLYYGAVLASEGLMPQGNLLIFIIYQIELGNTFNVSSVRVCESGMRVCEGGVRVCEGGVRASRPHLHHLPDRAGEHLQCE